MVTSHSKKAAIHKRIDFVLPEFNFYNRTAVYSQHDSVSIMETVNPTVFVIDDDPAVRQSVCWLVESAGRRVEQYASADSFLEHYRPDQAGCVLTDVRMPGLGGLQLQETLKQRGYAIPVIIMTAYGDVSTAVRAMKAGAVDFLEKPYSDQALLDLIEGKSVV